MTLTNGDFEALKDLIKTTIEEETETLLATKEEIRNLPTKEEFFSKMDEMMGEIKAMREEHTLLSNRVYEDHENRIEKIEKSLHIQARI